MTKQEYDDIQLRFDRKIENSKRNIYLTGKRQEGFETGVLACKSILSEIYRRQTGTEKWRK